MSAADSDIRVHRDLAHLAFLAEEQILRQHAVPVFIVDPVVPRILHVPEYIHFDERAAHAAAVDPDLLLAPVTQFMQFLRRELRFKRIVEPGEPHLVQILAHVLPAGVFVGRSSVGIVAEAYINRLVQQILQRVFRKHRVVVHHENVIVVSVNRCLYNMVSGRGAIVPSYISEIGGASALVQIPYRLIGIRKDALKCRDGDQDSEVFVFLVRGVFFGAAFGISVVSPLQANASSHVIFLYFL